jgi:transaldolase
VIIAGKEVKLFADGADLAGILEMYAQPYVSGFTTNPTLMRRAGVANYLEFAGVVADAIRDKPVSFEVLSDDFAEMEEQGRLLSALGGNVYVKVPVTDTRGKFAGEVIDALATSGVKLNVTALLATEQVEAVSECLTDTPAFVSVFAGRIADTGRDPVPLMRTALRILEIHPHVELIWASPRELFNVIQAAEIGCHVITATNDIIKKLPLIGKDLRELSLETVQMFHNDAVHAGYHLADAGANETVVSS